MSMLTNYMNLFNNILYIKPLNNIKYAANSVSNQIKEVQTDSNNM